MPSRRRAADKAAILFKHVNTRYVDRSGNRCKKGEPGARRVKVKSELFHGYYLDEHGCWRRVALSRKKQESKDMLRALEDQARALRSGEREAFQSRRPLAEHLAEFRDYLAGKGRAASYYRLVHTRIKAVLEGCHFHRADQVSESAVERFLADLRDVRGRKIKTSNYYLAAFKEFFAWLVDDRRLPKDKNPVAHLKVLDDDRDDPRERRVLTHEEFVRFIDAAGRSDQVFYRLDGRDRAMLYLTAAHTGYRAAELHSLTPAKLRLGAAIPTADVAAAHSKRRRNEAQPLQPQLVALLIDYLEHRAQRPEPRPARPPRRRYVNATGRRCRKGDPGAQLVARPARVKLAAFDPSGPLWPGTWFSKAAEMVRLDLAAAREAWLAEARADELERRSASDFLSYENSEGQVFDFHALRAQYITGLVMAGLNPKAAQELARHSDPRLTFAVYTKLQARDVAADAARVWLLPDPPAPDAARATGTHGRLGYGLATMERVTRRPETSQGRADRQPRSGSPTGSKVASGSDIGGQTSPSCGQPASAAQPALRVQLPLTVGLCHKFIRRGILDHRGRKPQACLRRIGEARLFAAEPPHTAYDLHFMLGRVPVRVHPLFWLMSVLLIANSRPSATILLLWMLAVFVSILVHEMGHALAYAYYGIGSHVVLYSFGGLAVADSGYGGYGGFSRYNRDGQTHEAQMIISFAGPLAGFLLAGAVVALVYVSGHYVEFSSRLTFLNFELGDPERPLHSLNLQLFVWFMLEVNIMWGIMNLLPIYPLDGGQIARALLSKFNPYDGLRQSLVLSMFTAGGIALLAAVRWQSLFMALMFGFLSYSSYQALNQMGGFGGGRRW